MRTIRVFGGARELLGNGSEGGACRVVIATIAMKQRYRLLCRKVRGGTFYCVDSKTGKRTSLGPLTEDEAEQVIAAKNQAGRQPRRNLQIAQA